MAYTTIFEDIVFIEGGHPNVSQIKSIKVDLSYKFGAQLKNLTDVKRGLATQARELGGNCITEFQYGQKSKWLAIDDVAFWGSGNVSLLPQDIYNEIISKKR